jgi:predicted nucleic acid-binding protein
MKPSIYIETSIPSFYYEVRTEPGNVARREWARLWWNEHLADHDAYTSEAVIEELEEGSLPGKADTLKLIEGLPLLDIDEPIADIVANYISHHVMPNDPAGDALHLAVASFHKCDFLVTWNCRHLANANKFLL